jgi:LmbE family N-acetylglucosaminyl deacetylase
VVTARALSDSPWARARWLVLAPHADDETLGVGALIAQAAAERRLAGVVYLTDGTGSHPAGTPRLAAIRRAEAALALRRLTGCTQRIAWLDWRDAHPHTQGERGFVRDRDRLGFLLRSWRVDAVAVTAAAEPHCDHAAAHDLAHAAAGHARRRVALFDYHVWSAASPHGRAIASAAMPAGKRRHALRAHRSQLTLAMGDGFRLAKPDQSMPARDILFLSGGPA